MYVCAVRKKKSLKLKKNAPGQGSLLPIPISLVQSFPINILAFLQQVTKSHRIAMRKYHIPKSNCYQELSKIIKPRAYL